MEDILKIIAISLSVILVFVIGYDNYFEYQSSKERIQTVQQIESIQKQLDNQFNEQQMIKKKYIESLNRTILQSDEDKDRLTYEQEIRLGTSDYNNDTDLDGVPDGEDPHPAGGGETFILTIEWNHNEYTITSQFGIPYDMYHYMKNKPRMPATSPEYVTYNDPSINIMAKDIADVAQILDEDCMYCTIINFVQSMLYEFDIDYIGLDEYPKYPIETIVDKKGDCEDTSYLLAALYKALGIDAVLVLYPGHMATAVACDDCKGSFFELDGKRYYYIETTAQGWTFGQIPDRFRDEKATLVEIA